MINVISADIKDQAGRINSCWVLVSGSFELVHAKLCTLTFHGWATAESYQTGDPVADVRQVKFPMLSTDDIPTSALNEALALSPFIGGALSQAEPPIS